MTTLLHVSNQCSTNHAASVAEDKMACYTDRPPASSFPLRNWLACLRIGSRHACATDLKTEYMRKASHLVLMKFLHGCRPQGFAVLRKPSRQQSAASELGDAAAVASAAGQTPASFTAGGAAGAGQPLSSSVSAVAGSSGGASSVSGLLGSGGGGGGFGLVTSAFSAPLPLSSTIDRDRDINAVGVVQRGRRSAVFNATASVLRQNRG